MKNTDKNDEGVINLLPYYVYELRDPRSNEVFYVGKGTGDRIDAHSAEEENRKAQEISDIEQAGLKALRVIVARFETEEEALAVESVAIKWHYGSDNLTNLIHGHRHRFVRPHQHQLAGVYPEIPGIDRERRISGLRDGKFTQEQRRNISDNAILEKLESLRDSLMERVEFSGLTIGEPDLTVPQDPCILVSGFSSSVQLQIKMQLTGATVVLNLIPIDRAHREGFVSALTKAIAKPLVIKTGNRFGKYAQTNDFTTTGGGYPRGIPHEDITTISRLARSAIERLSHFVE